MLIDRVQGCTRVLGQSQGYIGLPIRDEVEIDSATGAPTNSMTSAWQPTLDEVLRIQQGAPVYLTILGTAHPPVRIEVGEPPEA